MRGPGEGRLQIPQETLDTGLYLGRKEQAHIHPQLPIQDETNNPQSLEPSPEEPPALGFLL